LSLPHLAPQNGAGEDPFFRFFRDCVKNPILIAPDSIEPGIFRNNEGACRFVDPLSSLVMVPQSLDSGLLVNGLDLADGVPVDAIKLADALTAAIFTLFIVPARLPRRAI
jgi:hypothetical protein